MVESLGRKVQDFMIWGLEFRAQNFRCRVPFPGVPSTRISSFSRYLYTSCTCLKSIALRNAALKIPQLADRKARIMIQNGIKDPESNKKNERSTPLLPS